MSFGGWIDRVFWGDIAAWKKTGANKVTCEHDGCGSEKKPATPYEKYLARQKDAVDACEAEALSQRDFKLWEYERAHEKDRAGYSFYCSRWGDFLAMYVEREGVKFCTALKVADAVQIALANGVPPGLHGTLRYCNTYLRMASHQTWDELPIRINTDLDGDDDDDVARWMVRLDGSSGSKCSGTYGDTGRETTGYAFPARDDQIRFERIGATVYAPVGRGTEVYAHILRALSEGPVQQPFTQTGEAFVPGKVTVSTTKPPPKHRRGRYTKGG